MSNMVVRTNVLALNSHRNLGMVGRQQANASSRLSSGFRINSAADDAAGLGISEKMRSQIRGLDQASRNAQDGVSLIQTAEGAMSTINDMVVRIRELVVQAANDTNAHEDENRAQSDRVRIQDEINQLMDEIDATRNRTQFNTRNLIDGSLAGPTRAGFDQLGFDRAVARAMNGKDVQNAIIRAGDIAVAADQNAFDALKALNTAKTNLSEQKVLLALANGKLEALQNALDGENLNVAEKEKLLNAALEQLKSNPLTSAAKSVLNGLVNMFRDVINKVNTQLINSAGVDANDLKITYANFMGQTISFLDDNGDMQKMTLGDLDSKLGTTGYMTGETFNNALEAIKESLEIAFTVSPSGMWNGADIDGNANADKALDIFRDTMASAFSNASIASFKALTSTMNISNAILMAAVTAAQAMLSSARVAQSKAMNSVQKQYNVIHTAGGVQELYDKALNTVNSYQKTYDRLAAIARDPAEAAERKAQETRLKAELDHIYRTEDSDGNALWFQVGANVDQGVRLSIEDVGTRALSRIGAMGDKADEIGDFTFDRLRTRPSENVIHGEGGEPAYDPDGGVLNVSGEEIQKFITAIDEALAHVTGQRSKLGAMQNRLDYTMQNLNIASENLSASESRIRDADMAKEMMRLTQSNVLQQAATAMLAQANQAPQSVLQLLG